MSARVTPTSYGFHEVVTMCSQPDGSTVCKADMGRTDSLANKGMAALDGQDEAVHADLSLQLGRLV